MIEGDIVEYYDNIKHSVLISQISKVIHDQQIIDLIWKFLRAGVIKNGRYSKTLKGIPQGSIISPILSNIYLDLFDNFIEDVKHRKDTKETSIPNKEYYRLKALLHNSSQKKNGYQRLRSMKSTVRVGFKLYYLRYADD